jgi:general secretion pathway protein K
VVVRRRRPPQRKPGERGAALLVVLWGLALAAMVVAAITMTAHSQALVARNAVEAAKARLAAEGGVQLGIRQLLASAPVRRKPFVWRDEEATVRISIQDEEGKIDLNEAPFDMLLGLFRAEGLSREEALPLACRTFERRGYRAADCFESAEAVRLPPVSGLFSTTAELRHLPGMTDALFQRIAPHVTVYPGSAAIDPMTATRDALLAVPTLSEGLVDEWLARRDAGDGPPIGGSEAALQDPRYFVGSRGEYFTVEAAATVGTAEHRVAAVLRLTRRADRPYALLEWREPPGR